MNNFEPKISVIIPIYNVEKYIDFSFETLANQTLKEVEFICIIDGSKDNSQKLVEKFVSVDNRFKIIYQENSGQAIAKNNGLKIAKGEFIAFFDPDDMLPARHTLELLYNSAKTNNVKICGGSLIEINNGFYERSLDPDKSFARNFRIKYKDYQYCYNYQRFIYERKFLLKNNLFFPELHPYEDPPWFVKTMNIAEEFIALQEPTYIYRITHNTITKDKIKIIHQIKGFNNVITYAYQNELWRLYRYLLINVNVDYWRKILEDGYNLYPEEIGVELEALVSGFDYSIFEKQGLVFQLNDFLSKFTTKNIINN